MKAVQRSRPVQNSRSALKLQEERAMNAAWSRVHHSASRCEMQIKASTCQCDR